MCAVPVKVQPIVELERGAHLEPGAVLLVVAPALALQLARRQVLLERARLVVEAEEQGLCAGGFLDTSEAGLPAVGPNMALTA